MTALSPATPSPPLPSGAPPEPDRAAPAPGARERRCLVSGETRAREELIRFVVGPGPEGTETIVPDLEGSLPGRGLWITARRDIVAAAVARRLFQKAARAPIGVSADLAERVARLALGRFKNLLGLARRSGAVAAGFEQTRAWLAESRAGLVLAATDAAANACDKLAGLARDVKVLEILSAEDLGAALGRERVVQVAIARGRWAQRLTQEAARLAPLWAPPAGVPVAGRPVAGGGDRRDASGRHENVTRDE